MRLEELLNQKGYLVRTVTPHATLADVVSELVRNNCGSLVVCDASADGKRMLGIITERDILRATAAHPGALETLKVSDYMTRDVVTGARADTVEQAMGIMTERRVRHLPVVDDGELIGIISIGDVVKVQYEEALVENHYLKTYIQQT